MVDVPLARFEALVADALDGLPESLGRRMSNVWVVVEEVSEEGDGLLGLYDGVPLTEREAYGGMVMPDRIVIYRRPICAICANEAEVVDEVRDTIVHEVAHHFGISDDRLDELGWS